MVFYFRDHAFSIVYLRKVKSSQKTKHKQHHIMNCYKKIPLNLKNLQEESIAPPCSPGGYATNYQLSSLRSLDVETKIK